MPSAYNPATYLGVAIPGFGLIVFVLFTAFVGAATKNLFGRQLCSSARASFDRMPVVRSIYNGVKQIIETVLTSPGASFQNACLIEYPRRGLWALAFISTQTRGEVCPEDRPPTNGERVPAHDAEPHLGLPAVRAARTTWCCWT